MGIRIVKPGVFDTAQDGGRYGLQHLGINPGGAADTIAYAVANLLVGNSPNEAALEMYYPAAQILFEKHAMVALGGADFNACINGSPIPINTPIAVSAGNTLECTKLVAGCCCYLAVMGGFTVDDWAASFSTNVIAMAGGFKGRKLQTGDVVAFNKDIDFSSTIKGKLFAKMGWQANVTPIYNPGNTVRICKGNEYDSLGGASKNTLVSSPFTITPKSNRMGCRLQGLPLQQAAHQQMVSTGVTRGAIQLLPSGQLVVLMADHQTTGGYPCIAHVISADLPTLAQQQPGKEVFFNLVDVEEAENLLVNQHQYLQQLQIACNLRLEEFLHDYTHH